jgi:hypothetical protein
MENNETKYAELSKYLARWSLKICAENGCTDERHNCESYAYIRHDGRLLDVCASDYFQGCHEPHAAVSLPWDGTAEELRDEVADQCADVEAP